MFSCVSCETWTRGVFFPIFSIDIWFSRQTKWLLTTKSISHRNYNDSAIWVSVSFCRHDNDVSFKIIFIFSHSIISERRRRKFLDKISIPSIQYIKKILSFFFIVSLCGMKNQSISSHHPLFTISINNAIFLYPCAQIYEKWKFSSSNFLLDKKSSFRWRSFSFASRLASFVPVTSSSCKLVPDRIQIYIFHPLPWILHIKAFPFDIF